MIVTTILVSYVCTGYMIVTTILISYVCIGYIIVTTILISYVCIGCMVVTTILISYVCIGHVIVTTILISHVALMHSDMQNSCNFHRSFRPHTGFPSGSISVASFVSCTFGDIPNETYVKDFD